MSEMPITKCEGCVFAQIEETPLGDVQTGCDLKRDLKLGVKEFKSGENSFTLERFCNTYRPEKWLSDLDFEQRLDPEGTVLEEIYPRIGFIVKLDLESDNPIGDLNKTLESICGMEKKKAAYVIVVNEKVEYNEEIWGLFITYFGEEPETKYHIVQLNETHKNIVTIIDASFGHAQNGWIQCLTSGEEIKKTILVDLHNFTNVDMNRLIMLLPTSEDGFSGITFPAFLFKFLNGNGAKIFSDETVDSRSFITKVLEAEKRGETKTVYSWEEFYAA